MLPRNAFLSLVVAAAFATVALAQQGNTTVQLPTFNLATTGTTVSVPDGGTATLGGIMRASEGSVTRGVPILSKIPYANRLFKNRGIGRDVSSSNMSVVPRIIILEEEEFFQTGVSPETLSASGAGGAGRGFGGAADPAVASKAAFIARNIARNNAEAPSVQPDRRLPSVDEILRQNGLVKSQRTAEAAEFYAKGRRAEAEGKQGVARVYYQMAFRRADRELQGQIAARLGALASDEKKDTDFADQ